MATSAPRDGFRPVHEAHAIEQLIVTVQFDRSLADADIRAAGGVMSGFRGALPGKGDILGMGFQIGPQGVVPIASMLAAGVPNGFVRTLSDGRGVVVKELRLERQSLAFRTLLYTRWEAVWREARDYFAQLLPVLGEANIAAYGLTYNDKFVWTGPQATCRPTTLLKQGSPYISPVVFGSTDLWHCHSGQFIASGGPEKRLQVVNLDCVDEADGQEQTPQVVRAVRITTALTNYLNQPGFPNAVVSASASIGYLDEQLNELHRLLKDVFAEIISDDAAKQVGLHANAS